MKSALYTRTGDQGTTSLVGGERVKKNSVRLEAYGTIDELSSSLGTIAADAACVEEVKGVVTEVQNELFNIGSYLATDSGNSQKCDSLTNVKIENLEKAIDALDEQTPKIHAFILPGGSKISADTHMARTICRRAERRILDLADQSYVDPSVIEYINRLSDYLFIAARYLNFMQGIEETVWKRQINI